MAQIRLSSAAQVDLVTILDTSQERWGEAARDRYEALLESAMRSIAMNPEGPLMRWRGEISTGVRSFHTRHARRGHGVKAPVHMVYFRISSTGVIEILRVLHERADPSSQVVPRDSRRRRLRGS